MNITKDSQPSKNEILEYISVHDFSKVSLLMAIATCKQFDLICLSETFLDSLTESSDNRSNIEGYNLIKADFPGNEKEEVSSVL